MAYNNYNPYGFQPQQFTPMQPLQAQAQNAQAQLFNYQAQTQPQSTIEFVNGLESANAYPVAPNTSKQLMDSTTNKFYVKTADASGFCTVKQYEFNEVTETKSNVTGDFVPRAEFDELKNQINEYISQFMNINKQKEEVTIEVGGN